jgi:cob(I)alamin adenosyltransferase
MSEPRHDWRIYAHAAIGSLVAAVGSMRHEQKLEHLNEALDNVQQAIQALTEEAP